MRKLLFSGLVLTALILAPSLGPDAAFAQSKTTKKDDHTKKDTKATKEDKADSRTAVIEVTKGKDDKFRFFVRDGDGKLLAMSSPGGFATEKEAEAAVERLKDLIGKAKVVSKDTK